MLSVLLNVFQLAWSTQILTAYGHVLIALAVFLLGMVYMPSTINNKLLKRVMGASDKYSYDIYLVHHIYILGNHSILKVLSGWIGIPIVCVLTVISALLLNKICSKIRSLLAI